MNEFKSFSNRFRNSDTIRIKDQREYKRIMKYLDKRGHQYYDIGHGKGEWHIQFDNTREAGRIRAELEKKRFKIIDPNLGEATERDYKAEYKKFQSSPKSKKYRAELNKYNRKKGTYGNGDGKDASHKGGKISGFEKESVNRGRREKSRLKKEQKLTEAQIWYNPKALEPYLKKIGLDFPKYPKQGDVLYKGKKVGYMDNFNGFKVYSKSLLKQLQKVEGKYKLGIWNPNDGLTMEQFGKEQKLREVIRKMIREDFAGSYPEHVRKKFDNTRRKQSEVLGYKLTGVNDVKTEIDDATVKESVYTLPRGSNTQDLDELDADLIRAGLKDKEVTPDFNKLSVKIDKTILKGSSVGVKVNKIIKKYKLKPDKLKESDFFENYKKP